MQTNGGTSLPVTRAPNGVTSPPMPNVKELMVEGGVMATKFYIHTPICCPSRAETLSGRYLHNVKRPVAEGQCADGCVRVCLPLPLPLPRRCLCRDCSAMACHHGTWSAALRWITKGACAPAASTTASTTALNHCPNHCLNHCPGYFIAVRASQPNPMGMPYQHVLAHYISCGTRGLVHTCLHTAHQ